MLSRPRLSEQRGFTFIELMVTMTIVTIGLGGVLTLVDGMNARSVATQERQSGTALVREVIEGARSVPYFRLTDGALDTDLQAQPGLTDSAAASGWTVRRRNREYTLDTQVCTVDDPKDGLGEHSVAGYCEGSATGTADRNPDDYRRLSVKALVPLAQARGPAARLELLAQAAADLRAAGGIGRLGLVPDHTDGLTVACEF